MTSLSRYTAYLAATSLALVTSGCSSSSSDPPATTTTTGSGGGSGSDAAGTVTSCAKNSIKLEFDPMYSAYDGVHKFQIPVITRSIDGADLTWSASDPSMVDFAPETLTPYHGVMVTTRKAGTVSIIASAGTICGSALLTITAATPDDWEIGNARYNSGEVVSAVRGQIRVADGGDAKCTNCHGDTAMGPYKTVSHSPVQTGGFSDDELVNIFQHGNVPEGGVFDTEIVSYNQWHQFHQWGLSDDEAKGMIIYLRSLTPVIQNGGSNFGMRGGFEGGFPMPEGGFQIPEGGMGMRDTGRGNPGDRDGATDLDAGLPPVDASVTPVADASAE